jgi:hypothetical protein
VVIMAPRKGETAVTKLAGTRPRRIRSRVPCRLAEGLVEQHRLLVPWASGPSMMAPAISCTRVTCCSSSPAVFGGEGLVQERIELRGRLLRRRERQHHSLAVLRRQRDHS